VMWVAGREYTATTWLKPFCSITRMKGSNHTSGRGDGIPEAGSRLGEISLLGTPNDRTSRWIALASGNPIHREEAMKILVIGGTGHVGSEVVIVFRRSARWLIFRSVGRLGTLRLGGSTSESNAGTQTANLGEISDATHLTRPLFG
jgi:hypothetical protein